MKEIKDALEEALSKLRVLSGEIQVILANASAMSFDVEDMTDAIRNEAFEIVDACDATDDGFDYEDDAYFDMEND